MKLTNKDCSCEEQQGSISITDDLIEDAKAAGFVFSGDALYCNGRLESKLAKLVELQRQRERQAVASGVMEDKRHRNDGVDLLLRAVFQVCEDTENIDPKNDFERGRVFEAKGIRRGIGNWFQDTFCGRSFMGEPAMLNAAPSPELISPKLHAASNG